MEPISLIVGALVAGAAATSQGVAAGAVQDAYAAFKALLLRKFAADEDVADAVAKVAKRPDSAARQDVLAEELSRVGAAADAELLDSARRLYALLHERGASSASSTATNTGSGAIAQGPGAVAAGERGVAAGGDIRDGSIVTGDRNVVARDIHGPVTTGDHARQIQTGTYIEHQHAATTSDAGGRSASPIKILFLAASPHDMPRLRLDQEMRAIDGALRSAEFRERFDIRQHWAVRIDDLQELLLRHQPHVVHFSGHGSAASEIILEDAGGRSAPVPPAALSRLFRLLRDNIRCVVLNACYSDEQAAGIAAHIDCVVGMKAAITDAASLDFATAFYRGLGYGRDVRTAFELGCSQIDLGSLPDADQPVLRGAADPTGVRFVD